MKSGKRTLTAQEGKKLHARSPMGPERIACGMRVVLWQGQIRE